MVRKNTISPRVSGVLALSAALVAFSPQAPAQENAGEAIEEIVVKAYRSSLMAARDLKRNAVGSQDSIVAEDIADFPDLNLAESLQRVPGVAITREGGEGRQISLRGLGPDFTRVQLNGMEVLGNTSSPMDSRGAVSRNRAFDFNIFASELFSRIDIMKSYSASMDEGGIGGTVNLRTAKPFDQPGTRGAVSVQFGTNEYTDDVSPRFAALASTTTDTFGALVSVAYSERETIEQGYNTFRWRTRTTTNVGPGIDAATAALLAGGVDGDPSTTIDNLWFARGNRLTVWENRQERLGITGALQFRPNDRLSLDLDMLYGELNNDRAEWHLATSGSSSTALGRVNALEYIDNNGDLEVVYGEFSDVTLRTESRRDTADTTFWQAVLSGEYAVNDRIVVSGLIGREKSDFDVPESDKLYYETVTDSVTGINVGGLSTDFRGDRFDATNTYSFDPANPANWQIREVDLREDYATSEFDNAKLDIDIALNDSVNVVFGVMYKKFTNDGVSLRADNFRDNRGDPVDPFAFVYGEHEDGVRWVAGDVREAIRTFGIDSNVTMANATSVRSPFGVTEETIAAYSELQWETLLGDKTLRGNFGLRYYDTDTDAFGTAAVDGVSEQISVVQAYDGVLPALNLALDLTDSVVLRLSASENLTRPALSDLAVSGTVLTDPLGSAGLRISSGNPALEPFESQNIEGSVEWYFDEIGFVALGAFHKDIDNFIVSETVLVPYGETGYPLDLLPPDQNASTIYQYTRPQNIDSSTISGFELAFQRDLDFLPAPFDDRGVIANYTIVDGEATYRNVQGTGEDQTKNFPGLSEDSGNFTVYYETDNWGARIATAYRSDYISRVEGGLNDEDERGFHATTNVDFSFFYQFNDDLKFVVEGTNLTNEVEEQYSDSSDRPYNSTTSGRTFYVGATYKF